MHEPESRGYFGGALSDVTALVDKDIRRTMPRFSTGNYPKNLRLLESMGRIAHETGCSMAQLALAWLRHRGDHVIPVPGTTSVTHLVENLGAADVALSADTIARLDSLINQRTVAGERYAHDTLPEIDTETFN